MGWQRLEELIGAGCSPTVAVDYLAVTERGYSQSAWARKRGVAQPAVAGNVKKARDTLGE